MKISDIFILPSLYEGLPVTVIEAQASKLKCILSNTIDKRCDLGMNLVDFLSIEGTSKMWSNRILEYKKNNYNKDLNVKENLIKNGYDAQYNSQEIESIYKGNLK